MTSENIVSLLISAGVSGVIAFLIALWKQKCFFSEQDKRNEQKLREDDKKKVDFMLKAFLQEAKYNLSIINTMR